MKPIELASELARRFEGFYPDPYLCPAGVPTIGFGCIRYPSGHRVTLSDMPITKRVAERYLQHEMEMCSQQVLSSSPNLHSQSHQRQAAIIDFVYNLGIGNYNASTLKKRIDAGQYDDVPNQLRRWVKGGGRTLRGLVIRRDAECDLWSISQG